MADVEWIAWEPPEYVEARGPSLYAESAHFVVRWGLDGPSASRAAAAAPALLSWLERAWELLCDPSSPDYFVTPYTTPCWCNDGLRRKLNVYIGDTGLHPHPHSAGWAHQGTWVERVQELRHALSNPEGKLHHSFLALAPGAAVAERTVVHEFGHVLQMHTGGHIDSSLVGYQWEAHAEYCTHLRECKWAPHVPVFLRTAHLPVDCTNYDGEGEGGGRQYIVWPFYAYLDRTFGRGTVHALWHTDRAQRQRSGHSLDMISNLRDSSGLLGCGEGGNGGDASSSRMPSNLAELFGHFAHASLTLDWASRSRGPEQAAALLAAADALDPLRFTPLRPAAQPHKVRGVGRWWVPDGSRPLKRCGFGCHRLLIDGTAEVTIAICARKPHGGAPAHLSTPPCDLLVGIVGYDRTTGERHVPVDELLRASVGGDAPIARFVPQTRFAYMVSVCAGPREDAHFVPLPWGTPPSDLPTCSYALGLSQNCSPHPDVDRANSGDTSDAAEAPLAVPAEGVVAVPTGLPRLHPVARLSGGGASRTSIDLRSGNPNEVNTVRISGAINARGCTLVGVAFAYRYVVGFSACEGEPGPIFELQLIEELGARQPAWLAMAPRRCVHCEGGGLEGRAWMSSLACGECEVVAEGGAAGGVEAVSNGSAGTEGGNGEGDDDESAVVHVLYSSPPAGCTPSWDVAKGGSPTNYSQPVRVDLTCDVGPLRGRASLRIVFRNGRRNLHLQGVDLRDPCELGLRLSFQV